MPPNIINLDQHIYLSIVSNNRALSYIYMRPNIISLDQYIYLTIYIVSDDRAYHTSSRYCVVL